jgi:hypothetical protein
MGYLLAQQLLSAGKQVLDMQSKLGVRVRLLAAGAVNRNGPNHARSVASAALRSRPAGRSGPTITRDGLLSLNLWQHSASMFVC